MPLNQVVEADGVKSVVELDLCCPKVYDFMDKVTDFTDDLASRMPMSVVTDASFSLPEYVPTGTLSFTVTASSRLDSSVTISKYFVTCEELGISKQVFSSDNITLNIPASTAPGTKLKISIMAQDSLGNKSRTVSHFTTVGEYVLYQPLVVMPEYNGHTPSEVDVSSGNLQVAAQGFTNVGTLQDIFASADYKVCSDVEGKNVIKQDDNISSYTNVGYILAYHTMTGLAGLSNGVLYYVFARVRGQSGAVSPWSSGQPFRAKTATVVAEGREVARMSNGWVSVKGSIGKFAVAPAQHRGIAQFILSDYADYKILGSYPVEAFTNKYIDLGSSSRPAEYARCFVEGGCATDGFNSCEEFTEAAMDAYWPRDTYPVRAPFYSAKSMFEWWRLYVPTLPAYNMTQQAVCEGEKAYLPNALQLMRILCSASFIDDFDTTLSAYPKNGLRYMLEEADSLHALTGIWSCTIIGTDYQDLTLGQVYAANGRIGGWGTTFNKSVCGFTQSSFLTESGFIIPIVELPD